MLKWIQLVHVERWSMCFRKIHYWGFSVRTLWMKTLLSYSFHFSLVSSAIFFSELFWPNMTWEAFDFPGKYNLQNTPIHFETPVVVPLCNSIVVSFNGLSFQCDHRSAKTDMTSNGIHSFISHSVSGCVAPWVLRGKHLIYWGTDPPSLVRQCPIAPQWSWGKCKWPWR